MSALPHSAIERASDLEVPDEDRCRAITRNLPRDLREQFLNELLCALAKARHTDDLTAVQDVITAWFQTAVVRSDPRYVRVSRRAHRDPHEPELTAGDAKKILGV